MAGGGGELMILQAYWWSTSNSALLWWLIVEAESRQTSFLANNPAAPEAWRTSGAPTKPENQRSPTLRERPNGTNTQESGRDFLLQNERRKNDVRTHMYISIHLLVNAITENVPRSERDITQIFIGNESWEIAIYRILSFGLHLQDSAPTAAPVVPAECEGCWDRQTMIPRVIF